MAAKTQKQIMAGRACLTIALFLYAAQAIAQKSIEVRDQVWLGYFNQIRITNRSGVWTDLQFRSTGHFINSASQSVIRAGYTYYASDSLRLTAGYAYVTTYGQNGFPDVPEQRLWQQLQWNSNKNRFNLQQGLRIEERFRRNVIAGELMDAYTFNWRFRYILMFQFPLKGRKMKPKVPFLFTSNEIHINAGKQIDSYFDQNRFAVGLGYPFTKRLNIQIGYLNVFQQLPSVNQFVSINAVRLLVYHNLDFRK